MYRIEDRFPVDIQIQLTQDTVALYDREVKLTVGLLQSPHRRVERRWFKGALALTRTHLVAYAKQRRSCSILTWRSWNSVVFSLRLIIRPVCLLPRRQRRDACHGSAVLQRRKQSAICLCLSG